MFGSTPVQCRSRSIIIWVRASGPRIIRRIISRKTSKSKGNIVDPFAVMRTHGADATRWYLLSASVPWKPRSFSEDDLGELERKLFGTLTNTYGFFALYANIDKY